MELFDRPRAAQRPARAGFSSASQGGERVFGDRALGGEGLEADAGQVGGSGLQGVDDGVGGQPIEALVTKSINHLHERDLDGVGVL